MRSILALILAAAALPAPAQSVNAASDVMTKAGTTAPIDLGANHAPVLLTFYAQTTGQMGCGYQVEGSDDGVTWKLNVLGPQRCPSGSTQAESQHLMLPHIASRYVRVNVTHWFQPATQPAGGPAAGVQFFFASEVKP